MDDIKQYVKSLLGQEKANKAKAIRVRRGLRMKYSAIGRATGFWWRYKPDEMTAKKMRYTTLDLIEADAKMKILAKILKRIEK